MTNKEEMMQAEMMGEQLNQLEQQIHHIEQQHAQLTELIKSLEEFETLPTGETLVSLAPGIFAKGTLTNTSELLVNVGAGTFVKKTPEALRDSLQEQLSQMEEHEKQLRTQFDTILTTLNELKERFS